MTGKIEGYSSEQLKGYSPEQQAEFQQWWRQVHKKIEVADVTGPVRLGPPKVEETPRFPHSVWPAKPDQLLTNVEKYVQLALDLGAVEAKTILTKEIPQDLRALYVGCIHPACRWMNTNANCPMVRTFSFDHMKRFVTEYDYAVVFKVLPPKFDGVPDAGPVNLDMYYTMGGGKAPDAAMLVRNIIRLRILLEMERRIRQVSYYDGYLMSAPMSAGPCLVAKCADTGRCPATEKGGHCRFVDVQPNGSGCAYINYFALGEKLGWGQFQVGGNCAFPEDVPDPEAYYNIGLVLID